MVLHRIEKGLELLEVEGSSAALITTPTPSTQCDTWTDMAENFVHAAKKATNRNRLLCVMFYYCRSGPCNKPSPLAIKQYSLPTITTAASLRRSI